MTHPTEGDSPAGQTDRDAPSTPGPWEISSYLSLQGTVSWYVSRRVSLLSYEWIENAAGRHKRFGSEAAARAAIAKATGDTP